ncbi:MAG: TetR family transcriptional regulator [Porphyrobacter sp.]|nr:TetR family transcriptional regulator [Porphyrobacter sp.]
MSIRKRLTPDESRRVALEAARALLMEAGPQAVTLKAVGTRIDRTHANLLHHFGSAAGLQQALAEHLAATVCASIAEAAVATRAGLGTPGEIVELTFDIMDREGGGALATWMILTGNENALDPIIDMIHSLVDELHPQELAPGAERTMHEATLALVLMALGDAMMGERLAQSLQVPRDTTRDHAETMLTAAYVKSGYIAG